MSEPSLELLREQINALLEKKNKIVQENEALIQDVKSEYFTYYHWLDNNLKNLGVPNIENLDIKACSRVKDDLNAQIDTLNKWIRPLEKVQPTSEASQPILSVTNPIFHTLFTGIPNAFKAFGRGFAHSFQGAINPEISNTLRSMASSIASWFSSKNKTPGITTSTSENPVNPPIASDIQPATTTAESTTTHAEHLATLDQTFKDLEAEKTAKLPADDDSPSPMVKIHGLQDPDRSKDPKPPQSNIPSGDAKTPVREAPKTLGKAE